MRRVEFITRSGKRVLFRTRARGKGRPKRRAQRRRGAGGSDAALRRWGYG